MFKLLCVLVVLVTAEAAPPYRFKRWSSWCDGDDTFSTIPDLGFQINFENLEHTSVVDSFRNYHQSFNYATYSDDMYKIFIPLGGFTKSELKVESAGKVVFVEAMHRTMWSYMDYYFEAFLIPDGVNSQGTWDLTDGILILEFPLYNENPSPDKDSNPPIPMTTEEIIATTKVPEVYSVEETTTEIIPTDSSTDIIDTIPELTTPKEKTVQVEETTSEILPTSTDITEVKEYSEDYEYSEVGSKNEIIIDDNESYTPSTEIPEPASTTVKKDYSVNEYNPFVKYDDSPQEVDQTLAENMDLDFYITTSIPLPTELNMKKDHINEKSPFVFSFPKIPDIEFNPMESEEKGIKDADPKTEYEVLSVWD